jgi:competence protein ComGC
MIKSLSHFIVLVVSISFILNISCSNSAKKPAALLNTLQKEAAENTDLAKTRMIQTAVQVYNLEYGRPPQSLAELVEKRFLKPEDILDHSGEKLPFSADESPAGSGSFITKSCGACGKPVASSSKVGDRCPHCGVKWDSERRTN